MSIFDLQLHLIWYALSASSSFLPCYCLQFMERCRSELFRLHRARLSVYEYLLPEVSFLEILVHEKTEYGGSQLNEPATGRRLEVGTAAPGTWTTGMEEAGHSTAVQQWGLMCGWRLPGEEGEAHGVGDRC